MYITYIVFNSGKLSYSRTFSLSVPMLHNPKLDGFIPLWPTHGIGHGDLVQLLQSYPFY